MALSPKQRQDIAEALSERGVTLPCPRCGDDTWTILDAYISHSLTRDAGQFVIGGPVLPTVGVMCGKCGFLAEHAAVALGLIPSSPLRLRARGWPSNNSSSSP